MVGRVGLVQQNMIGSVPLHSAAPSKIAWHDGAAAYLSHHDRIVGHIMSHESHDMS